MLSTINTLTITTLYSQYAHLALSEASPVAAVHQEDDGVHGGEVILPYLNRKKNILIVMLEETFLGGNPEKRSFTFTPFLMHLFPFSF